MTDWPSNTFVGGHLVLDFLNTGGGDTKARDVERLASYQDVLSWSVAAGLIDADENTTLAAVAESTPDSATECLMELRAQRESLYHYLLAMIDGTPVPERDRQSIETSFRSAASQAQLVMGSGPLAAWRVGFNQAGLSLIKSRLSLAASTLITDPTSAHICQCEMCSWFFLDASASRRRRWCSMALCGNRAKAQRHYQRSRDSRKRREA